MTKEQLIELVKFTAGKIVAPTTLNHEDAESIVDDFVDILRNKARMRNTKAKVGNQMW